MKVLLEEGVWIAIGEGDPPRTTIENLAKEYHSKEEAIEALTEARKSRPFPDAQLTEDFL